MGRSGKAAHDNRTGSEMNPPMAKAMEAKDKGNQAFSKASYKEAERWFTVALDIDPSNAVLYSNRSAALMMLGEPARALCDANKAVQLKPAWGKAYYRKGISHIALEQYEAACATFALAMQVEPENLEFQRLLNESKDSLANFARSLLRWSRIETFGSFPQPREGHAAVICRRKLLVFGGVTDRARVSSMWQLNLDNLIWTQITGVGDLPPPMDGHCAVSVNDEKMFVFAGRYDVNIPNESQKSGSGAEEDIEDRDSKTKRTVTMSNTLYILDVDTMTWTQPTMKGEIPSPRCYHASALLGEELWVFGGMVVGGVCSSDVHAMNVKTFTWRKVDTKGDTPSARWRHGAAVLPRTKALQCDVKDLQIEKELVFLFGGLRGSSGENEQYANNQQAALLNDMYILDTQTETWKEMEADQIQGSVPAPRVGHTVTTVGRGALVFGGLIDCDWATSDVHIFDADTATWSSPKIPGLVPSPRGGHTASLAGQNAFVVADQLKRQYSGDSLTSEIPSINTNSEPHSPSKTLDSLTARDIRRKLPTEGVKGPHVIVFGGASPAKIRSRFKDIFALDVQSLAVYESSFVSVPVPDLKFVSEIPNDSNPFSSLAFSARMPPPDDLKFELGVLASRKGVPRWGIKHIRSIWRRHLKHQIAERLMRQADWTLRWRRRWRENWRSRLITTANRKEGTVDNTADNSVRQLQAYIGRKRKHTTEGESDDEAEHGGDYRDDEPGCDRCEMNDNHVIASSQLLPAGKTEEEIEGAVSNWSGEGVASGPKPDNEIEVGARVPLPPLNENDSRPQIKERPVPATLDNNAVNIRRKTGVKKNSYSDNEQVIIFSEDLLKPLEAIAELRLSLDLSHESDPIDIEESVDETISALEDAAVGALSNLLSYMEVGSSEDKVENTVEQHTSAIRFTHHITRAIGRLIRAWPPEPISNVNINSDSAQAFTSTWLRAMAETLSVQDHPIKRINSAENPGFEPLFGPSVALTSESLELLAREAEAHIRAQGRSHARIHGAKCISMWLQGSGKLDSRNLHVNCDCCGASSTMSLSDESIDDISDERSDGGGKSHRQAPLQSRRNPSPGSRPLFSWKELSHGQSIVCSWRTVLQDTRNPDGLNHRRRSNKHRGITSVNSDTPFAARFSQVAPNSLRNRMLRVYSDELEDLVNTACSHRKENLKKSLSKLDHFYSRENDGDTPVIDFAGIGPSAAEYVRMGGRAVSLCHAVLNCKSCSVGSGKKEADGKKTETTHLKDIASDAGIGILALTILHLRVLCVNAVAHVGGVKRDKGKQRVVKNSTVHSAASIAHSLKERGQISFLLNSFQDRHNAVFIVGRPQEDEPDAVEEEEEEEHEEEETFEEPIVEEVVHQNARTKRKMRRRERRMESTASESSGVEGAESRANQSSNSAVDGEGWQGVVSRRQRGGGRPEGSFRGRVQDTTLCEAEGCDNRVFRRNLCRKHCRTVPKENRERARQRNDSSRVPSDGLPPLASKNLVQQKLPPTTTTTATIPPSAPTGRVQRWSALFEKGEKATTATESVPSQPQQELPAQGLPTPYSVPVASDLSATAPVWMPPFNAPISTNEIPSGTTSNKTWSLFPASTVSPPLIPLPFLPDSNGPLGNWSVNDDLDSEAPVDVESLVNMLGLEADIDDYVDDPT